MSRPREFEVILLPERDGGFSVSVPDLPGCYTQGHSYEEALANAKEAIEGYLESVKAEGGDLPKVERHLVTVEAPSA